MGHKCFYIFFCIAILFSCQQGSPTTDKSNDANLDTTISKILSDTVNGTNSDGGSLVSDRISADSCHKLLLLLIKSCSLDSKLKELKFDIRIEEIHRDIVKLELIINNEERNEDVALSWLEMDFYKRELRDITVDPNQPIKLKYDPTLFRRIDELCRVKKSEVYINK
jgi:hypothetical protein